MYTTNCINYKSYSAGSWEISLSNKGASHNEKFIKLCLLVCCELLGTDIVCKNLSKKITIKL